MGWQEQKTYTNAHNGGNEGHTHTYSSTHAYFLTHTHIVILGHTYTHKQLWHTNRHIHTLTHKHVDIRKQTRRRAYFHTSNKYAYIWHTRIIATWPTNINCSYACCTLYVHSPTRTYILHIAYILTHTCIRTYILHIAYTSPFTLLLLFLRTNEDWKRTH